MTMYFCLRGVSDSICLSGVVVVVFFTIAYFVFAVLKATECCCHCYDVELMHNDYSVESRLDHFLNGVFRKRVCQMEKIICP